LDFTYKIKKIYNDDSLSKLEENKDYSQEEEGKSNNIYEKVTKNKSNGKKMVSYRDLDEERNFIKESNRSSKTQINNKIYKNYNEEIDSKESYKSFFTEIDKNSNQNVNRNDIKMNNTANRTTNTNPNDKNLDNFIISDTQRSYNNTNNNHEISNDYIQSTFTNNQYNIKNKNNTSYSKNNFNSNKIKNKFDDSISNNQNYENINSNEIYKSFKNFEYSSNVVNNLKIDKNIHMSFNPKSNDKGIEITRANIINIINKKIDEKTNKGEKPDSNKLSVYEKELIEELNNPVIFKNTYNSDINSLRKEDKTQRKNNETRNSLTYLNHIEMKGIGRCEENISEKKDQNNMEHLKIIKQIKSDQNVIQKYNSSFNTEKSNKSSTNKESTNPFSNNHQKNYTDSYFNNSNNQIKDKISNQTERKLYKLNPIKIERSEIYSPREIDQLNLFMGCNIKNKLEINRQKIDYYIFHKLTNTIRNIQFDKYQKMKYINNLNIINERFVNISYEVLFKELIYYTFSL